MLSVSPNSLAQSSLEAMLDSIRRRDENEKPKDTPPDLPARPKPTPRARLPSPKRTQGFEFEKSNSSLNCNNVKKEDTRLKGNRFGSKRVRETGPSPYVMASSSSDDKEFGARLEGKEDAKLANSPEGSDSRFRECDWDDSLEYFMNKKLRVWCCPRNSLWESGQIRSTSGEKASVLLSDGSVMTVPSRELLPANPDILDGVDDLAQLSFLNDPSVLHNLHHRYCQDIIYTKAGPILVSVNPLKDVPLYGNDFITAYRQKLVDSPHVYAVADTAYNEMMKDEKNQSIIISGESGAGKTKAAKIALQYLAVIGEMESKLLQAISILEAFGNAKTSRNDNSSRFGKLIEIQFSASGKICGAKIQTFLLEKSRVVQLANGDRSYHIFYQLCAGAPPDIRGKLKLKSACNYNYLNQSGCLEIHGFNEIRKFHTLMEALNTVGICKIDQEHALEMLAGVLWLGNISFNVIDSKNHIEIVTDEAVTNAASLIGCSTQNLVLALSSRKIQSGNDEASIKLTLQQASDTRDALAMFIYSNLFEWLVEEINLSFANGKELTGRSISILDIYGFESFKKNGFEQFCINYANERLQQHFNRHLLKLEQEEYELDGIDWTKIEFEDNQECLDLFEKKPIGLIYLLDEESNSPKATDLTFSTKLNQNLNAHNCFKGERDGAFSVRHSSGEVLYSTSGFLEKNRDPLHPDIIQLLLKCTTRLPQFFASTRLKRSSGAGQVNLSVATKFKDQVFSLMQQLDKTTPHFIHCIKPNSKKHPGVFEKDLVLEQIKYSGLLEAVRISRSGYPTRMTHQEFTRRYEFLVTENNAHQDPLSTSVAILQKFDILPEMYQFGYTKLYLRAGLINALDDVRKQFLQGTLEVQNGHGALQYFHETKEGVTTLQAYVRGEITRKEYGVLLGLNKQVSPKKLNEQLMAVVQIQSVIRGWLVRKNINRLQNLKKLSVGKRKPGKRVSGIKDLPPEMLPVVVQELQKQVMMTEETLDHKEKENTALRIQVQQFEARWSEYEAKMKSVEEMWQKQMSSLQMNLSAAKRSLATGTTSGQPKRLGGSQSPHLHDPEDMSMGPLVNEFEQNRQNFENAALAIVEVKSVHSSVNPVEEIRKLKQRFNSWRKEYKIRLREAKAKAKAQRLGQVDTDQKYRRKWWGKRRMSVLPTTSTGSVVVRGH